MDADLKADLVAILRKPGFAPLLERLHTALARHGVPRGRVEVATYEEADALGDLIPMEARPGKKVSVAEIDRLLRERTIFHCSLEGAIVLHRGAPIVRPREVRERTLAARERAVRRCFEVLPSLGLSPAAYGEIVGWLHASENQLRAGFTRWGADELLHAVRAVARAFDRMPGRNGPPVFLAELANEVAGEAHGLDTGRPAGTLLFRALEHQYPETARRERRGSAAWKANLLSEAGIARDPVSVRVDTFGLVGDTPYLRELRQAGLTRPLNLDDLARIGGDARAWRDVAFVVENPTVFASLLEHVRKLYTVDNHPTLVCTYGTLNLADKQLLDALVAAGAHLFYSGDFDAKGLEIAAGVLERYGGAASPWRMTTDDYRAAVRDPASARPDRGPLDPRALQRSGRRFPELVAEMSECRRPADHEGLIDHLRGDLDRFVSRHETPPRRGDGPDSSAPHLTQRAH